jgi:Protein of unknown function (DUF1326)
MKKVLWILAIAICGLTISLLAAEMKKGTTSEPQWSMNATTIESCSCPMFCQCYFATSPAGHHEHGAGEAHYCKFNMAYKINSGKYGSVSLAGAKFWVAGDLGSDFSKGQTDWAIVTFDKAVTKEQRDAIGTIAGKLFPVKWNSFTTAEGNVDTWNATDTMAHATLDGGKSGEIKLMRPASSASGNGPIVIKNLKYWGAPRNDGFVLMTNEVNAYRVGPKAFETNGTNGFMITVDLKSSDFKNTATGGM